MLLILVNKTFRSPFLSVSKAFLPSYDKLLFHSILYRVINVLVIEF